MDVVKGCVAYPVLRGDGQKMKYGAWRSLLDASLSSELSIIEVV